MTPLLAAIVYSSCRRTLNNSQMEWIFAEVNLTLTSSKAASEVKTGSCEVAGDSRALENDIRAPDMAPLMPPVRATSKTELRHR